MRSACVSPKAKASQPNFDEAAKWYDRAAQAGVVPAIFRLGTFYEKGLSVKKDVDIARRYYLQAAERGNAKAMHNLAVLDADGGGKGANYKSAAQWFRKAADRGVADSQFNLGILYARGIGVEQNLAESFKWFSLAAAQGDADSAPQARRYRQAARRPVAGRGKARDPDLHAGTPARRRHQRGDPGRRMGLSAGAGHRGKARGQAGFDQADRRRALSRWRCCLASPACTSAMKPCRSSAPSVASDCLASRIARSPRGSNCLSMIVRTREIDSEGRRPDLGSRRRASRPTSLRHRRLMPPATGGVCWSVVIFILLISGVGIRAYRDLSRPEAWAYWKDLYFSPSMTSSLIASCRSRRFGPWPARTCDQRQDRRRHRELVSRQARRSPSRGGRRRIAVVSGRRFESGHDHGRNHSIARTGDRGRRRRRLGSHHALLLRQRLRARLCRRQAPLWHRGLDAGGPSVCDAHARSATPSPKPSGPRGWS